VCSRVHVDRPSFAELGGQTSSTEYFSFEIVLSADPTTLASVVVDGFALPFSTRSASDAAFDAFWNIDTMSSQAGRSQSESDSYGKGFFELGVALLCFVMIARLEVVVDDE
jgi:hypothetical protein